MSGNPFGDPVDTNPYASPIPDPGLNTSKNPLLIPAIVLLVMSSLFLMFLIASIIAQISTVLAIDTSSVEGQGELFGNLVGMALMPLMNLGIILGASSMIRLKSYRSAYAAAVISIVPICSPCFVLGIPFGIWAIVVLNRPEVRQRFS